MMGEISYKISQLGPGIGGGARILNKPHSSLTPGEVEKQGIDKKQSHCTHLKTRNLDTRNNLIKKAHN